MGVQLNQNAEDRSEFMNLSGFEISERVVWVCFHLICRRMQWFIGVFTHEYSLQIVCVRWSTWSERSNAELNSAYMHLDRTWTRRCALQWPAARAARVNYGGNHECWCSEQDGHALAILLRVHTYTDDQVICYVFSKHAITHVHDVFVGVIVQPHFLNVKNIFSRCVYVFRIGMRWCSTVHHEGSGRPVVYVFFFF